METFGFSSNDLDLIRRMPRATVGGGMIMPSGLQMKKDESRILTDNFEENVRICWGLIEGNKADDEFWEIVSTYDSPASPLSEQKNLEAPYFSNSPSEPRTDQSLLKKLTKFLRGE